VGFFWVLGIEVSFGSQPRIRFKFFFKSIANHPLVLCFGIECWLSKRIVVGVVGVQFVGSLGSHPRMRFIRDFNVGSVKLV
jgi:hypothetical protein